MLKVMLFVCVCGGGGRVGGGGGYSGNRVTEGNMFTYQMLSKL